MECQPVIAAFTDDPRESVSADMTKCQVVAGAFVRLSDPERKSAVMLTFMEARIPTAYLHRRGYYQVRPSDVISRTDLLLLDVRFASEDLDGEQGHIHQCQYLPLAELELFAHPTNTPTLVICGNGRESVRAAERLAARGYTEIYHLVGGMLRWNAEERPVARAGSWRPYKP